MPAPPAVDGGLHIRGAADLRPLAAGMVYSMQAPRATALQAEDSIAQRRSQCYAAVELSAEKLLVAFTAARKL